MKSISSSLQAHLERGVTTLCTCWEIHRRDGQKLYFTDHSMDLLFNGNRYVAAVGYTRSNISNDSTMSVDNLDVHGILDTDLLDEVELRGGLYDYADVFVFMINYLAPSMGIIRLRRGKLGEVILGEGGIFKAELRGMSQLLSQRIGELVSPECRTDLGSPRCTIPIDPPILDRNQAVLVGEVYKVPNQVLSEDDILQEHFENRYFEVVTVGTTAGTLPTYDYTIEQDTTDGTAILRARNAWMRHATITAVTSRRVFDISVSESRASVNNWFKYGAVIWESGDNNGFSIEISGWNADDDRLSLFLPTPFVPEVGDKIKLYPGCDKRWKPTCVNKFDNGINFQGEPFVPGQDEMMKYPDAK